MIRAVIEGTAFIVLGIVAGIFLAAWLINRYTGPRW